MISKFRFAKFRFSVEYFLSHSTETFRWGTLLCLRKIMVLNFFAYEGKYHDFPSKFFCLTLPENVVVEPFLVSKKFRHRKFSYIRRGLSRFSVVLIKLKMYVKGSDSHPHLSLQNLVVLLTVPWEQLEILTNVSVIIKISETTGIQTRTYCLRNFCPNPTAGIYFGKKELAELDLKKK